MSKHVDLAVRFLSRYFQVAGLLAIAYWALGAVPVVGSVLEFVLNWFVPLPELTVSNLVTGLISILLGAGIALRKRVAWLVATLGYALFLLLTSALLVFWLVYPELRQEMREDGDTGGWLWTNTAITLALLLLLLRYRRCFVVRSQRGNVWRALLVLVVGAVAVLVIGFGLMMVFRNDILSGILEALMSFGLAVVFVASVATLMRSQRLEAQATIDEERRVRELLVANPTDSLGYFATRRDKSVFLTERGAVVYRVGMGVALASGDPLGNPAEWPATVAAFKRHAESFGWLPAVIGASEAGARAYMGAGLRALAIGDEAVLTADKFALNELPEVRRAVVKLADLGYSTRIRRHRSIPGSELAEVEALAEEWLSGEPERGFSMALGRLGDPSDGDCVLVEALFPAGDERGHIAGLLSFAPWGADGASLDVMRRHPRADNGVTELMITALMTDGRDLGIRQASLNFAVFRAAFAEGARIGAGPVQRLWRRFLLVASHWWQLESLYRSNAKYEPTWRPRLICYPESRHFARVAAAAGVAEGFLTLPRWLGGGIPDQPRRFLTDEVEGLGINAVPQQGPRLPQQVQVRIACREAMLAEGIDPYPASVTVTAACATAVGDCTVAGRVMTVRDHGGVLFATLRDASGELQVVLEAGVVGDEAMVRWRRLVRAGDQVAVTGTVGASRTGTRSLLGASWRMTSKALRPLPDKRKGLQNPEARVRLRHVDLIVNDRQRQMVRARSNAIQAVRQTLLQRRYLEVETPILQPVHGGANARPFRTHINAYDLNLYLRIAPELYLKRLMVGGLERVFEIGRNFRNEGADATHNPEFTMLEAYQAYADYHVMKDVIRDVTIAAAEAATGSTVVRGVVGGVEHEIDLADEWRTVTITEAVSEGLGEQVDACTPVEELQRHADRLNVDFDPRWGWGTMLQELYEHLAESSTVEPTFFSDFPAETSPLTRQHRTTPRLAERWDLIIFGSEVGTAYSELVDPVVQRERLTTQSLAAAGGDPEAMELDEAFLQALEQGMPPTGGLGMGLDRLVMMLTKASIRETIAFPLVRPGR